MKSDSEFQTETQERLKWPAAAKIRHAAIELKDSTAAPLFAKNTGARRAARQAASIEGTVLESHQRAPLASHGNDEQISREIARLLEQTTGVLPRSLKVQVESGWVTLTGELDWNYQKAKIIAAIHYMPGVDGLSDEITIKPRARLMLHKWGPGNALGAPRQNKRVLIGMLDTLEQGLSTEQAPELANHTALVSDTHHGTPGMQSSVSNIRGMP
ncbi:MULTISPECIES: BON domain-containing protein [Silvimonas]|uniref:BON domain-containing protein n=1 Tax=Silvimonas TaxID=300264 RepID=UPI0024B39927|nr:MULTISPECIES: BON domain-containing protein [Silvimonas]MDR3428198.1 BON domain-containing protein [Silvimonas sp.]